MKLEVQLPQNGVEADIELFDASGKKLDVDVSKIVISPYFFRADAAPTALYLRTLDSKKGAEIHKTMLAVTGTKGRAVLIDRSKRTEPKFYRQPRTTATTTSPDANKPPEDAGKTDRNK